MHRILFVCSAHTKLETTGRKVETQNDTEERMDRAAARHQLTD